jgi:hypothetical protein
MPARRGRRTTQKVQAEETKEVRDETQREADEGQEEGKEQTVERRTSPRKKAQMAKRTGVVGEGVREAAARLKAAVESRTREEKDNTAPVDRKAAAAAVVAAEKRRAAAAKAAAAAAAATAIPVKKGGRQKGSTKWTTGEQNSLHASARICTHLLTSASVCSRLSPAVIFVGMLECLDQLTAAGSFPWTEAAWDIVMQRLNSRWSGRQAKQKFMRGLVHARAKTGTTKPPPQVVRAREIYGAAQQSAGMHQAGDEVDENGDLIFEEEDGADDGDEDDDVIDYAQSADEEQPTQPSAHICTHLHTSAHICTHLYRSAHLCGHPHSLVTATDSMCVCVTVVVHPTHRRSRLPPLSPVPARPLPLPLRLLRHWRRSRRSRQRSVRPSSGL